VRFLFVVNFVSFLVPENIPIRICQMMRLRNVSDVLSSTTRSCEIMVSKTLDNPSILTAFMSLSMLAVTAILLSTRSTQTLCAGPKRAAMGPDPSKEARQIIRGTTEATPSWRARSQIPMATSGTDAQSS